jgi:hypothetical protein
MFTRPASFEVSFCPVRFFLLRNRFLQALLCFSQNKPEVIQRVEREVWACVCQVADGTTATSEALQRALIKIADICNDFSDRLEPGWFSSKSLISPVLFTADASAVATSAHPPAIPNPAPTPGSVVDPDPLSDSPLSDPPSDAAVGILPLVGVMRRPIPNADASESDASDSDPDIPLAQAVSKAKGKAKARRRDDNRNDSADSDSPSSPPADPSHASSRSGLSKAKGKAKAHRRDDNRHDSTDSDIPSSPLTDPSRASSRSGRSKAKGKAKAHRRDDNRHDSTDSDSPSSPSAGPSRASSKRVPKKPGRFATTPESDKSTNSEQMEVDTVTSRPKRKPHAKVDTTKETYSSTKHRKKRSKKGSNKAAHQYEPSSEEEDLVDLTRRIRFDDPSPQYIDDKTAVRVIDLTLDDSQPGAPQEIPNLQYPAKQDVRDSLHRSTGQPPHVR